MAEKENMLFFETSAKSGDGVNMMIYSSITKLSFFDSYKDENKENMVKELIKINSSNSGKVYDVNNNNNNDSNYKEQNVESCANIILTQGNNNNEEDNKKKCNCWFS